MASETTIHCLSAATRRSGRGAIVLASLAVTAALALPLAVPSVSLAQSAQVGSAMIADKQFAGTADRDGVIVRATPSSSDFGVLKLKAGDEVVVVGLTANDFLRVLPPDGTYCLVPQAHVELRGDGSIGRVTRNASVRVGSRINAVAQPVAARLEAGTDVDVLGREGDFFKIAPPKGVFLYVTKTDVRKAGRVLVEETDSGYRVKPWVEPSAAQTPEIVTTTTPEPQPEMASDGDIGEPLPSEPTAEENPIPGTEIVTGVSDVAAPQAPTTQPTEKTSPADEFFARLELIEAKYKTAVELPLAEQPLAELKTDYDALLKDPALPSAFASVIQARVKTIEMRQQALADLQSVENIKKEMAERQLALEAEQQELTQRIENAQITVYDAVGQLQPSSLQVGGSTLYRLCDPQTGRTLIYLRATDETSRALASNIEQFVAVNGPTTDDNILRLTYISPSVVEAVNPGDVLDTVAARILPPSLALTE